MVMAMVVVVKGRMGTSSGSYDGVVVMVLVVLSRSGGLVVVVVMGVKVMRRSGIY